MSFYLFKRNKIKTVIIILIIGLFIHISSVIAIFYFLFLTFKKRKLSINIVKISTILGGVLIFAILLRILKNLIIIIADIFNKKDHLMYYLDFDRPIISIGLASRVFIFTSYLGMILYYQLLNQGGYYPYINIFI